MSELQTTSNGNTPLVDQAKKLRTKRNLPSLPAVAGATNMSDVVYSCKVDASPTSWESLNLYSLFSLAADGSYPHMKVSKSKAVDLRTGKSLLVGSGRCYRVII